MTDRLPILRDLLPKNLHLFIWCNVCERMPTILTAREACDRLGETTPIFGCWEKLRCRCAARGSAPGAMTAMAEHRTINIGPADQEMQRLELTKARARVIGWLAWRGRDRLTEMDPLWPKNLRRQTPARLY